MKELLTDYLAKKADKQHWQIYHWASWIDILNTCEKLEKARIKQEELDKIWFKIYKLI